ncbi:MAG: hypothetical protein LM571_00610 [Desulfurococcaceae archaeon]|nr:hypothetical protein [Desulfurococcaceae archaeon]
MKKVKALARVGGYLLPATVSIEEGVIKVLLGSAAARTMVLRSSLSITEIGEILGGREIEIRLDTNCRASVRRLGRKLRPTDPRDRKLLEALGIGPQGFKDRIDFISDLYVVHVSRGDLDITLVVDQTTALVLKNLLRNYGVSTK